MISLEAAGTPAFLKLGVFGHTGTGKTYTFVRMLSQFIREFAPDSQLAMFDTEGGGAYLKSLVKEISGKDLLIVHASGFAELLEFADLCRERRYVAMCDSITHPWRSLISDYTRAKQSRVKAMGGNPETVHLALKDWGPIKDLWAKFANKFRYDSVHWAILGREGDVWDEREDEEGNKELTKSGVKMKTETEMGYEPSLLVRMEIVQRHDGEHVHRALVVKDRFAVLTGKTADDPDIEFFRPHLARLALGERAVQPVPEGQLFGREIGRNWEAMQHERQGILEKVKDDLLLAYPGQTAAEKKAKVEMLRAAFGDASWAELENDARRWDAKALLQGRDRLVALLKGGA